MALAFPLARPLARRIAVPAVFLPSYDPAARAFLDAAAIETLAQRQAINVLVISLKAAALWDSLTALYPFVGGAAAAHSFNLKSPSLYQITWGGTLTHNANGVTGNGSSGYGNTGLNSSALTTNSCTYSVYNRTNSALDGGEMGNSNGSSTASFLYCKLSGGSGYAEMWQDGGGGRATVAVSDPRGLMTGSRTSATDIRLLRNGSSIAQNTSSSIGTPLNANIYVLALNISGSASFFSNKNLALAAIGAGRSVAQDAAFYQIVQAFQTSLGRAV